MTRKTVGSGSLPHKELDPVPFSIRAHNVQGITITNCDVTTWSWVKLVSLFHYNCGDKMLGTIATIDSRVEG